MALDKDIVGSIEFLEVVGLQGSTYLLKGQMVKCQTQSVRSC